VYIIYAHIFILYLLCQTVKDQTEC
jgi:hypothetical protein